MFCASLRYGVVSVLHTAHNIIYDITWMLPAFHSRGGPVEAPKQCLPAVDQDIITDAVPYTQPEIVDLGDARTLTRSMSYGQYLDGDSNQDFRHKPS